MCLKEEFAPYMLLPKEIFSLLELQSIDSQNYKGALSQITKLQKKQPHALILKSLKALVLERSGKSQEALVLCNEVKACKPADEAILQALTTVYRSLGKHEEIVQLYESAARSQPKNEVLASHMFMAMVRNDDYKGQQQAALKLHKTFKTNRYLFWAIMSLILQAQEASPPQSNIFLTLAERMMIKAVEDNRLEETEEVHLYLSILLSQNKVKEALGVIDGQLGQRCKDDTEITRIRQDLLLKSENWTLLRETSKKELTETNADDWKSYLAYFEAVFHLSNSDDLTESLNKMSLNDVSDFLNSLKEKELRSSNPRRGPFLAELEYNRNLAAQRKDTSLEASNSLIIGYFQRFGSKACCFEDLLPYLCNISGDVSKDLVDKFQATIEESSDDEKSKIQNIQKWVNIHKLKRYLGHITASTDTEFIQYTNKLWHSYQDSLQYGVSLVETENQFGDDFVILASHTLIDAYIQKGKYFFIIKAILLLESAFQRSKHNFQLQLLLIRLYQIIGVHLRALEIYKSMDIKHIQLDTLSHFIVTRSSSLGFYKEAVQLCYDTLPIYRSNDLETPEMIVHAYKYGTYTKVNEFIEFKKALRNSLQRLLSNRESIRLEIIAACLSTKRIAEYFDEIDISNLLFDQKFCETRQDNRDFKVMANYNPVDKASIEELIRSSPKLDTYWLKVFTLVPLILKKIYDNQTPDEVKDLANILDQIITQPETLSLTEEEKKLGQFVSKLGFIYVAIKESLAEKEGTSLSVSTVISELLLTLEAFYTQVISEVIIVEFSWQHFNRLSLFLEGSSYIVIVIGVIYKLIGTKSKKSGCRELHQAVKSLVIFLKEKLISIKSHLNILKDKAKPAELLAGLLPTITSGSSLDFCSQEENAPFIRQILHRISKSWTIRMYTFGTG
ncbi:hypothetical protein G9A89_017354 [Geosiphon pyriformis]|nr:hypothetical protein G9A89_017354 [Geosiphon pyriformis]